MSFTGYQDMKAETQPPLPALLAHVDYGVNVLGLKLDWREITKAREIQQRADDLRTAFAERVSAGRDLAADVARTYAEGKTDAADVIEQAATSAALAGESGREARRLVEHAANAVQSAGAPLIRDIGEERWLKLLRPLVAERIDAANAVADEIGIDAPRPVTPGVRRHAHPWAPTDDELRQDMPLRHRWERLDAALQSLDEAFAFADTLRAWRLLPMVPGRDVRESYRWLRVDRLDGTPSPSRAREFWLANRRHGEPGLFAASELAEHDATPSDGRTEPYDEHAAHGGRRVLA